MAKRLFKKVREVLSGKRAPKKDKEEPKDKPPAERPKKTDSRPKSDGQGQRPKRKRPRRRKSSSQRSRSNRGPDAPRSREPAERRSRAPKEPWDPASFRVPVAEGKARFHDFDIPDEIMHAIADLGFEYCTPIQEQALPHTLKGADLTGKAQTGTGKTAAFLITALAYMLQTPRRRSAVPGTPRCLIIAPTRELVIQICQDAQDLEKYCGLRSTAVYGGMDYRKQQDQLTHQVVDIVAATPGRLLDFHSHRDIHLREVEILVIDEADRMLDMGFIPDVRRIVRACPHKEDRQTMFFSATINDTVMSLAKQWTRRPVSIEIQPEQVAVDTVEQCVWLVTSHDKYPLLYNILKKEKPTRTLVFCNRRDVSQRITDDLLAHGIHCALLSGAVNQKARLKTLDAFRAGKVPVVVATDVAGRGIHVEGIDLVINYDIPYECEDYVHRIGRTGRAGAVGKAYTLACEEEAFTLPEIEEFIGQPLPYKQPDPELLEPPPPVSHRSARRAPSQRRDQRRRDSSQLSRRRGPRRRR